MKVFFQAALALGTPAAPTIAQAEVYHSSDWETSGFTGSGKWKSLQTAASYSFQRVTSPVRTGNYAVRVEVRSGQFSKRGTLQSVSHVSRWVHKRDYGRC